MENIKDEKKQMITGNIRTKIFTSESGFFVGTFKVKDTNEEELKDLIHKTITITGLLIDANEDDTYTLIGSYQKHERYGYQFQFQESRKEIPEGKDALIEFLSSSLIKGCGMKTAKAIVETLGENALEQIKENKENLMLVPNMTASRASKIYLSIMAYSEVDDTLITLKNKGFTIPEATKIVKHFQDKTLIFLAENIYYFKEFVPFDKLDKIFLMEHASDDPTRIKECLVESMKRLSNTSGDVFYRVDELIDAMRQIFTIFLEEKELDEYLEQLEETNRVIIEEDAIYLSEYYEMEVSIAHSLERMMTYPQKNIRNVKDKIAFLEELLNVKYNQDQKTAIEKAILNPVSIISGGPGTGKTTIVNAITKLFIEIYKLSPIDVLSQVALLAPTGRAAKKLSTSTGLPAMTIHRYLKWNKDTNDFAVNEKNKNHHKLIIVDETSMIDTHLFYSLLNGILESSQIVFVGDTFQLPSVGAGLVLNDLVESKLFPYTSLETIYRQSENSYIPILAKEIKEKSISEDFKEKKDDYNFIHCDSKYMKEMLKKIVTRSIEKGLKVDDIQILAPMYKGENGIDNLNLILQELLNPKEEKKKEIQYYDVTYREQDKVLQLTNNPDCNVYNGDIGYIESIKETVIPKKHLEVVINFDGNRVIYGREDLSLIKHAYAITIHKSQGSEFPHVILPISKNYYKMLYNKLIYTGVSRAKKSLVMIGEENAFEMSILNDYSANRKTSLKKRLWYIFQSKGHNINEVKER